MYDFFKLKSVALNCSFLMFPFSLLRVYHLGVVLFFSIRFWKVKAVITCVFFRMGLRTELIIMLIAKLK